MKGQSKIGHGRTGQDTVGQCKRVGQGRAEQEPDKTDRTGQDRTG
jgi:hypothetical protein